MCCKIAIVGRPNVGKSTLFNRLVGRKIAIVDDRPGVTRDRRMHEARLYDLNFQVIDTAGLEEGKQETLGGRMRAQTSLAVDEADIVLFVFDAIAGITALDEKFAMLLRKSGKPIILVANKSESKRSNLGFHEAWSLGFGEPCAISSEHGMGMSDLRDAISNAMDKVSISPIKDISIGENTNSEQEQEESEPLRIAIVGRPNVGKSTFINSILGEDRLLTGDEAGLTRDSISIDWEWRGRKIKLFDTAGLRRRSRVNDKVEKLSVAETFRAIKFSQIVVIMFDATASFEKQDLHIVDLVIKEGRAPVIAFNKWDLVENPQATLHKLYEKLARLLPQVKGLRAVPISALQTNNAKMVTSLDKLMENVVDVYEMWNKRIPTALLNKWLASAVARHPAPIIGQRRLKIKYATQVKSRPPTFVLYSSKVDGELPLSYSRYIINSLRVNFDIWGVPVRIFTRASKNPYA